MYSRWLIGVAWLAMGLSTGAVAEPRRIPIDDLIKLGAAVTLSEDELTKVIIDLFPEVSGVIHESPVFEIPPGGDPAEPSSLISLESQLFQLRTGPEPGRRWPIVIDPVRVYCTRLSSELVGRFERFTPPKFYRQLPDGTPDDFMNYLGRVLAEDIGNARPLPVGLKKLQICGLHSFSRAFDFNDLASSKAELAEKFELVRTELLPTLPDDVQFTLDILAARIGPAGPTHAIAAITLIRMENDTGDVIWTASVISAELEALG